MKKPNTSCFLLFLAAIIPLILLPCCSQKQKLTKPLELLKNGVNVFYFFTSHRCKTCLTIERLTKATVSVNFSKEVRNKKLSFNLVQYDIKANRHYLKHYKLLTKSVVISRIKNGKEISWKNLDKIWELVNSPEQFKNYITKEITTLLKE